MKTRRAEVDLLRAFGIILMVLGHVGLGNQFSHFIHAFHMPMWFIVSGYFVNIDSDVKHYVQKRFKSLIIPYLCWGIPFEIAISSFGTGGYWIDGVLFPNVKANGTQWFFLALFISTTIGFLILKYFSPKYGGWVCFLFGVLASVHPFSMPLAIDSALVGIGFFGIGYILKSFPGILEMTPKKVVSLGLVCFVLIFINPEVNMRTNAYNHVLLFWANGIIATVLLWNCAKLIVNKASHIPDCVIEVGRESIIYPSINHVIIRFSNMGIAKMALRFNPIFYKSVLFFSIMLFCFQLNRVLKKGKLKFLVGR